MWRPAVQQTYTMFFFQYPERPKPKPDIKK
jgi:hypothetical protein